MEFSSETKAQIVQFLFENKDFVTSDDNDKWNELLNSLANSGVIGVTKEDIQRLWEQLRDSTIGKVKSQQSLDENEQLIVSILSHSDADLEPDTKAPALAYKPKTAPKTERDTLSLTKRKLLLECKKLENEIEKVPLECVKLELEIQMLQQKLLRK